MGTEKIKAIELVFDWNLWPRHEAQDLDSTNLTHIKQALRAGLKLPPVIINQKDNRIIDGFHRTKAYLQIYGDNVEIEVEKRNYKNDADIFAETIRLNSLHGLPLSPLDRVHAVHKARKLKIPYGRLSELFGCPREELEAFVLKRTAKNKEGENIALPGGALNLAGKIMTRIQENCIPSINGMKAASNATILLKELQCGAFLINDRFIKTLIELRNKIDEVIAEANNE